MRVKSESEVAQSCQTLSDPMDHSLPGSSVHGIFQARILEWGAIAFSDQYGILTHIYGILKDGNNNPICKTEKETQMYRTDFWTVGEGEGGMFRENSIETSILSSVKQITSPDWMHETSAQGWCIGKTQRDGMEREVGEGFRMGNTCKSMADSCQCMAKTTTIL